MSPFEPPTDEREFRLVVLISASETVDQMLSACLEQLKAQSGDDYVLAILIGGIDLASRAQCSAHGFATDRRYHLVASA